MRKTTIDGIASQAIIELYDDGSTTVIVDDAFVGPNAWLTLSTEQREALIVALTPPPAPAEPLFDIIYLADTSPFVSCRTNRVGPETREQAREAIQRYLDAGSARAGEYGVVPHGDPPDSKYSLMQMFEDGREMGRSVNFPGTYTYDEAERLAASGAGSGPYRIDRVDRRYRVMSGVYRSECYPQEYTREEAQAIVDKGYGHTMEPIS